MFVFPVHIQRSRPLPSIVSTPKYRKIEFSSHQTLISGLKLKLTNDIRINCYPVKKKNLATAHSNIEP